MSRHIADRQISTGHSRTRIFLALARRELGPHPTVKALAKMPRRSDDQALESQRLTQYLRIERGHLA